MVTSGVSSYPFPGDRNATLNTLPDRARRVVALAVSWRNGGDSIFTPGGCPGS